MGRPALVGTEFVDQLDVIVVIEFGARQDAVFVAGFEQGDRNHQRAGELEGMVLRENKIVRHLFGSIGSGPIPLDGSSNGSPPVAVTAKAKQRAAARIA